MDCIGLFWIVLDYFGMYYFLEDLACICLVTSNFILVLHWRASYRPSFSVNRSGTVFSCAGEEIKHLVIFLFTYVFTYLFSVLHHAKYLSVGCIVTGSQKGRGNQYIQLVYVLYCKLPTKGKQVLVFLLEDRSGFELQLQW